MKEKTWLEISTSALHNNIRAIRRALGPQTIFLAVVKSNAYGVGLEMVVKATCNYVDWYGVDSVIEAKLVRSHCKNPILIMSYTADAASEIVRQGFQAVVYDYKSAHALSRKASVNRPALIHLKVDTGLGRLGAMPKNAIKLAEKIDGLSNIKLVGLCTHYARVLNDRDQSVHHRSLEQFLHIKRALNKRNINPPICHTASSFAALLFKETRLDMVRIGIPMYGIWGRKSTADIISKKNSLKLRPVLSWKTTVISIKKLPAGSAVGYGSKKLKKETVVAILGVGFGDGLDKRYSSSGFVLIRGKRAPVLGSIAMNMSIVDASGIIGVRPGDTAVLLGKSGNQEISAYDLAKAIGTSAYEIFARLNALLPRKLIR